MMDKNIPKGYCPECGKPSNKVEFRTYNIGLTIWILECAKCGKWDIQARK